MYEDPEKMTYTEQATKRKHCEQLTRCSFYLFFQEIKVFDLFISENKIY